MEFFPDPSEKWQLLLFWCILDWDCQDSIFKTLWKGDSNWGIWIALGMTQTFLLAPSLMRVIISNPDRLGMNFAKNSNKITKC